jgi:hypothetical protein
MYEYLCYERIKAKAEEIVLIAQKDSFFFLEHRVGVYYKSKVRVKESI